ncbi:MAG: hypothetical protein EOP11_07440 [Proteobacteria bacterium]|nr:MAG: hypothetical protein EOP11_07440 [Pseudomonadota bacterium]
MRNRVFLAMAILLVGCTKAEGPKAANDAAAKAVGSQAACLLAGTGGSMAGVPPPGGWKLDPPCCAGLVDRESVGVCGQGGGGAYAYTCVPCGNGACDPGENHCNCAEDCK